MRDLLGRSGAKLVVILGLLFLPGWAMAEAFEDPSDDGSRFETGEALNEAGHKAFRAKEYARAIELYQQARDHFDGTFNPVDAMFAVFSIGTARRSSGDLRGAEIAYREAWKRAKEADYLAGMALATVGLADVYQRTGRRADAIWALSTAQELYRRGGHPKEAAQTARDLAALQNSAPRTGDRDVRQASARPRNPGGAGAEELPPLLPAARAQVSPPGQGRSIAELEAWVKREPGNLSALQRLASTLAVRKQPVRSNIIYGKMIVLSEESGFDIGVAEAYAGVGLNYIALGNRETGPGFSPAEKAHHIQRAEEAFRRAIAGFQKLGRWSRLAQVGEHLGNALELQGKLVQANDAYRAAITAFVSADDRPSAGRILMHIAWIQSQAEQYDQSLLIYEQAEKLFRELGDDASRADVLMSSGGDLIRSGRGAEAIKRLRLAAAINGELSRGPQYAVSLYYLAGAYLGAGREHDACKTWQAALEVTRRTGQGSLGQGIIKNMRRCGG